MTELSQRSRFRDQLIILVFAAITFFVGVVSPPHLMDDVDATQGEIAKTMLLTGDWITARVGRSRVFRESSSEVLDDSGALQHFRNSLIGVATLPGAIAAIALCLLAHQMAYWAGAAQTGFYAGLVLATSIGLFLFTRIVIPDVLEPLALVLALYAFLRTVEEESASLWWRATFYIALACGVLLKGLIGLAFPVGICLLYLAATEQLLVVETWRKLRIVPGRFLAIAAPWHILAILRNPPYFDLTLHADPNFGHNFRGFFWFYFINDQFLRFTNGRWPHDYNTVPRVWFWLYHLLWFFPWSFFLVGLRRTFFRTQDRFGRMHLLCLIWISLIMLFFTLLTTQEYYSMPIYPALALLNRVRDVVALARN